MTIEEYIEVLKGCREESAHLQGDLTLEKWQEIFSMSLDMLGFVEKMAKVIGREENAHETLKSDNDCKNCNNGEHLEIAVKGWLKEENCNKGTSCCRICKRSYELERSLINYLKLRLKMALLNQSQS
jgi:hypothetical protein